jgi:hypothetical protein
MTTMGFLPGQGPRPRRETVVPASGDDLFEMANLYPKTTGLPMTVWVPPRGHAQHDARIKVSSIPGDRMVLDDAAVVAIRPSPVMLEGSLSGPELKVVAAWISANRDVLIDYWEGVADTADLIQRLKRV